MMKIGSFFDYIMLLQREVTIHDPLVCSYVACLAADGQSTKTGPKKWKTVIVDSIRKMKIRL